MGAKMVKGNPQRNYLGRSILRFCSISTFGLLLLILVPTMTVLISSPNTTKVEFDLEGALQEGNGDDDDDIIIPNVDYDNLSAAKTTSSTSTDGNNINNDDNDDDHDDDDDDDNNVDYHDDDNILPTIKNDSTTTTSSHHIFHVFDEVRKELYDMATSDPPELPTRDQEFDVNTWVRGTGGLMDSDRILLSKLYREAQSVFEYGLGESTLIAAHVGVPRYAGVDSDPAWVAMARTNTEMSHFRFSFADIGDTKEWGNPVDETLQKNQYNYQLAPLVVENRPFDFYMVDGRYRVACACVSLLHAISRGADMSKVRVAIHDSDIYTRKYGVFSEVAKVEVKAEKLYVYKLKMGTTEDDIYKLWRRYSSVLT